MTNAHQNGSHYLLLQDALSDQSLSSALAERRIDVERLKHHVQLHHEFQTHSNEVSGYFAPLEEAPTLPGNPVRVRRRRPHSRYIARRLNIDGFCQDVHLQLSSAPISGYVLRVFQRRNPVYTLIWNWARRPQDQPEIGWTPTSKMNVASVSKLITAMACIRLLHERGISVDTPISQYMPRYFLPGANMQGLTFRHLLTHTSGFRQISNGGYNDGYTFSDFKMWFEVGVNAADIGARHYHNANFIGLRIAIAVILEALPRDFIIESTWPPIVHRAPELNVVLTDATWDSHSITAYEREVFNHVFAPAGVSATLGVLPQDALGYPMNLAARGAAHGAQIHAGTSGWRLSCDEVLSVLHTFRDTDAIVPRHAARTALQAGFGLDGFSNWQYSHRTQQFDCMSKAGFWSDGSGATMQSFVAFAPQQHTIAILVNSPIPNSNINAIGLSLLQRHVS